MIPVGVLPYYFNISGITSLWILMACNIGMIILSIRLYIKMDKASARRVMFSSYFYLMIVLLSIYADKNNNAMNEDGTRRVSTLIQIK